MIPDAIILDSFITGGVMQSAKEKIESAIREIEDDAYKCGIREGWSQLETIALVVPSSVTKKDVIRLAEVAAQHLKKILDREK